MADSESEKGKGRSRLIALGVVVVLAVAAFFLWRHLSPRESTDDAQVSGHVNPVAPRVSGTVIAVHVLDNQLVHAGDVLVDIDPGDYRVAVARAQADLAAAKAGLSGANTNVPITSTQSSSRLKAAQASTSTAESAERAAARDADASRAKLAAAKAKLAEANANQIKTAQDLDRLKQLVAKDEVSKQMYDAAVAAADAARAAAQSAQASVDEAQSNVEVADAKHAQAQSGVVEAQADARSAATGPEQVAMMESRAGVAAAGVQQAQASLDQAQLNLDRTVIRATVDGLISRKSVEVGQVVQPGQPLLAIVSLDDVWITANFKETQLERMRIGQTVDIEVDAAGRRAYHAHVDSIAAATGATFSLLPAENASGNFVKVVQRVPVKVVLDPGQNADHSIRPGMSVTATVWIK